ncbi:MAG TPA: hypothetical protein VIG62_23845 [Blastocatellia bacterium]
MTTKRKRSRAKTLALLCLVAHALFVCATHHHDASRDLWSSASSIVSAGAQGHSHGESDSTADNHCLSCRLQSSFVSDGEGASVFDSPEFGAVIDEVIAPEPQSRWIRLSQSGRAPPSA